MKVSSDRYPNDSYDHINPFVVFLMLEAPHAIFVIVPVCARSRMHASFAAYCAIFRTSCLRDGSMLDDRTCHGELPSSLSALVRGLSDEVLQN